MNLSEKTFYATKAGKYLGIKVNRKLGRIDKLISCRCCKATNKCRFRKYVNSLVGIFSSIFKLNKHYITILTAQKMKFSINDLKLRETADLVIFTEEILNGKLHFLCSDFFLPRYIKITKKHTEKTTQNAGLTGGKKKAFEDSCFEMMSFHTCRQNCTVKLSLLS